MARLLAAKSIGALDCTARLIDRYPFLDPSSGPARDLFAFALSAFAVSPRVAAPAPRGLAARQWSFPAPVFAASAAGKKTVANAKVFATAKTLAASIKALRLIRVDADSARAGDRRDPVTVRGTEHERITVVV